MELDFIGGIAVGIIITILVIVLYAAMSTALDRRRQEEKIWMEGVNPSEQWLAKQAEIQLSKDIADRESRIL